MPVNKDSIWFNKNLVLTDLDNIISPSTMSHYLGMEWEGLGLDFLKMRMPVDARTHQPYGLLHGGASCALAETVGSLGSYLIIDPSKYLCVGLEINANHIKGAKSGFVVATALPLHIGRSTHVWDIKIRNGHDELICASRLTVAIMPNPAALDG
jgi:1,4-dihydroxy-2-naphthoyl-CoA hydrolase